MLKRFLSIKRLMLGTYLALGAFLLAHTVNAFVADALRPPPMQFSAVAANIPSEPQPEAPRMLADAIVTRGLFPLPPGSDGSLASGQASKPPPPPLNVATKVALLGTVFGQQGGIMAVLEDVSTKKQSMYRMGEQISAVGVLSAIEKDRVLFRSGNQEEWLDSAVSTALKNSSPIPLPAASGSEAAPKPVARAAPARSTIDRRELETVLSDIPRLFLHAQPVPYFKDGKFSGLRLDVVNFYGFFGKLGLRSGDILRNINGVEINDPGSLITTLQQLKQERSVTLDIVRNDEPRTLAYDIR
jgi:general secretion pathway protein C